MKIIYIICFPPAYQYNSSLQPDCKWYNSKNELIGVWRQDWGHVFAKDVKKFFPECTYEVWRPDYRAEKEYRHTFNDGVIHRSFPAQKITFWTGLKPAKFWTSKELLQALEEMALVNQVKKELILHIPLDFSYLGHIILKSYQDKVPFLHTSHLNPNLLNPKILTLNPIRFLHRFFIKRTYKKHLSYIKEIAVSSDRIEFFKQYTKANIYQFDSLNFDFKWAKNKINKENARKKLGFINEDFILLSSSRIVPEKQLDKMITALSKVVNRNYKCIISGNGEKTYEDYLKKLTKKLDLTNNIIFTGFLSENLIDYYSASDVFITTSVSEGGPVSALKAIALNIPVISTDTGIAAYLLKQYDAGLILDRYDSDKWAKMIEKIVNGMQLKSIDPEKLEVQYGLENNIKQLMMCYKNSFSNFWEHIEKTSQTRKVFPTKFIKYDC